MQRKELKCPSCLLKMPASDAPHYDGYYNTSDECWSVYTEVLGYEFGNAVAFGHTHQLTVDAYAVQHAGASHPDKSVDVHLAGLHAVLDLAMPQAVISRLRQEIASSVLVWPHFQPPTVAGKMTIFDVALAGSLMEHIRRVHAWAVQVWRSWSDHHPAIARLVQEHGRIADRWAG